MTLSCVFPRLKRTILLGQLILVLAGFARAADLPVDSAVERAQRFATELERSGAQVLAAGGLNDAQRRDLGAVVDDLDRVLDIDKENVAALFAKAKLQALEQSLRPVSIHYSGTTSAERQAETRNAWASYAAALSPAQQLFDQVLAVAPENAEAYFWKARLHASTQPILRGMPLLLDEPFAYEAQIALATRAAQRAVEIDPTNPRYRLEYAQYLLMSGRSEDAARVVAEAKADLGFFHQLLSDFDALPKPEGAIASAKAALLYLNLTPDRVVGRVQAFLVPHNAAEVQAFYSTRWPGFRWFQPNKKDLATYAQYLTPAATGWRAARSEAEIPLQAPRHGLLVLLRESSAPLVYERGDKYPFANNRTYCYLWVMNFRSRR